MGMLTMGKLLLTMIKGIKVCIIKIKLHSPKYLVEPILKYGKYWIWAYLQARKNRV